MASIDDLHRQAENLVALNTQCEIDRRRAREDETSLLHNLSVALVPDERIEELVNTFVNAFPEDDAGLRTLYDAVALVEFRLRKAVDALRLHGLAVPRREEVSA